MPVSLITKADPVFLPELEQSHTMPFIVLFDVFFMHEKVRSCICLEAAVRTTIDLPESLIKEAMEASNQKTKTAVIITALEDYVRKSKIQGLKKFRGRVQLDIDLNVLRKRA